MCVFATVFGITLSICKNAPPTLKYFCPSNGTCSIGTVSIIKYQNCDDKNLISNQSWCEKLNCNKSFCAEYILNCGFETSQGIQCVPFQSEPEGWCSSNSSSLVFLVLSAIGLGVSIFAWVVYMLVICCE